MLQSIKNFLFRKNNDVSSETLANKNKTAYKVKKKAAAVGVAILRLAILISISYVILYPLIYMISSSLKTVATFRDPSVIWIPKAFTFENYRVAFKALNYINLDNFLDSSLLYTILFEVVAAVLEIMSCSIVAYGLARFNFKGKGVLLILLIVTILVPDQMIIIPKMMNFSNLDFLGIIKLINGIFGSNIKINILNTGFTFYLPSIFAIGLRSGLIIFIYMQFFKGLPKELEEAAWIDGAGLFRTFFSIALPSSGVVIVTVSIFSIIWHWNDYYLAVMYISKSFPLAVKLSDLETLLQLQNIWWGPAKISAQCAAALMFIFPMLVMYIILQKKFVKSIDRVGITG